MLPQSYVVTGLFREMEDISSSDVGRCIAPSAGLGDPTSRGWPILKRRPRQRGPDSMVVLLLGWTIRKIKVYQTAVRRGAAANVRIVCAVNKLFYQANLPSSI
jgi:hypothetical protein